MKSPQEHDTWQDGVVAQKDGQPIDDCPHPEGSPAWKGWRYGWRAAWAAGLEAEMDDET